MASRKAKREKIRQTAIHRPESRAAVIIFHIVVFLTGFVILFSRRPDALLNPQFYAEDGMVWYPQAYNFGLHSFLIPEAGYLHAFIRTVTYLALFVPFSLAPLVMNLAALAIEILPINVFLSSRFAQIPIGRRLLGCFVYVALPMSQEIHANLTNVQWHLALLACLVLLAPATESRAWRIFDGIVLVVTSFSTPIAILLVPAAAALWWKRRQRWSTISLALLVPGALTEACVAMLSHTRQVAENGASLHFLAGILGRQIFYSALLGWHAQIWLDPESNLAVVEAIATIAGVAIILYTLRYAPFELKVFVLFCFAVLALGLARPLAGPPGHPQWEYMYIPGRANRYYFLPMLGFLTSLFWLGRNAASPKVMRYFGIALLVLLPIGIVQDWSYLPFEDNHFPRYADQFEQAKPGTKVRIPIVPQMTMELTKK